MDMQCCFNQPLALRSIKERFFYRYVVFTALTILSAVASSTLGVVGFVMLEDKVCAWAVFLALINVFVGITIYASILQKDMRLFPWIRGIRANSEHCSHPTLSVHDSLEFVRQDYDCRLLRSLIHGLLQRCLQCRLSSEYALLIHQLLLHSQVLPEDERWRLCFNLKGLSDVAHCLWRLFAFLEKRRIPQVVEAANFYGCWRRISPECKRGGVPLKEMLSESSGFSSRGQRVAWATLHSIL